MANECVSRLSRLAGIVDIDKLVGSTRYNEACVHGEPSVLQVHIHGSTYLEGGLGWA